MNYSNISLPARLSFIITVVGFAPATILLFTALPAFSYPEYQAFAEKHSGRTVDCAMCHVNAAGPVGNGSGQVSTLNEEQMRRLGRARAAMEPGVEIDSPILNKFGNQIIKAIGRKKFMEVKGNPEELAKLLGDKSDLDDDGIPDSQEYLDGTHPLNKLHGDPVKLFWINLNRYKVHVILTLIAVFAIEYGIAHWLKGLAVLKAARTKGEI